MKLTPEDPRLSAYVLGEVSSDEALQVERAAASDPSIRLCLDDIENLSGFLGETLGRGTSDGLRPSQREAVLRASREADSAGKVVSLESGRRSWRPWLTGVGAAATVAFAAVLLSRLDDGSAKQVVEGSTIAKEVALLPIPGPGVPSGTGEVGVAAGGEYHAAQAAGLQSGAGSFLGEVARQLEAAPLPEISALPKTDDLTAFSAVERQRLPVLVGTSSATWVRRWIEEKGELPPQDAVRVEELINTSRLPTSWYQRGVSLGVETLEWRGTRWVGVQISAGEEAVDALELRSVASSERRLIGSFGLRGDEKMPSSLPANRATLLLLEFKDPGASLGSLEVAIDGQIQSIDITSVAQAGGGELKHAVAMAAFGLWLRDELDESRLLTALEIAEQANSDPVAGKNQLMIRRAMELAEAGR